MFEFDMGKESWEIQSYFFGYLYPCLVISSICGFKISICYSRVSTFLSLSSFASTVGVIKRNPVRDLST